jgi:membrane glycosyltransferase
MPIYNENMASACAALGAMAEALAAQQQAAHFEIFLISDTDDPEVLATERDQVRLLRKTLGSDCAVWYRHRAHNHERKAGNIRDFVQHWGGRYDYMVVLDADSLMTAEALSTLVREMDADPQLGLLQTLPRQYLGATFFARLLQFAGFAYGSVFARGLTAWQGDSGNYWGHNAIIRISAFAQAAGLPILTGRRPFGGDIRSHDFVEAALLRRAGWSVRMLPNLAGSWEESPRTLIELGIRDRRWAQGNMQHLAVLRAKGLHAPNRLHMLMGVMSYASSLLWLLMVMTGLALSAHFVIQQRLGVPWTFLPQFDHARMLELFFMTMALLFLPKGYGLIQGLLSVQKRGGASRLQYSVSVLLELLSSIIYAPLLMLIHSQHLWDIAWGHDSGWRSVRQGSAQRDWSLLLRRHLGHTLTGVMLFLVLLWLASNLWYWLLPLVIGMVFAIPLSALSGSTRFANMLSNWGLLQTPEEQSPHNIIQRRQRLYEQFSRQQPAFEAIKASA